MRLKHAIKVPKAGDALVFSFWSVGPFAFRYCSFPSVLLKSGSPACRSIRKHPVGAHFSYHAFVGDSHICCCWFCAILRNNCCFGERVGWNRCGPNDFRTSIRSNRDGYSEVDRIRRVALLPPSASCYHFNDVASFPVSCDKFVKLHTSLFRRNVHHFLRLGFLGFAYPSDTLSFAMNGISKVLSFTTAITLFLKPNEN